MLVCVICGGRGHKDRNCASYHGIVKLENDVCEICDEEGHPGKDCVICNSRLMDETATPQAS